MTAANSSASAPKLLSARPRVGATLQSAAIKQFLPSLLQDPTKPPTKKRKPSAAAALAALAGLKGQF